MLTGFDHITLIAADLDRAVDDYTRLLGTAPSYRGHYPDLGTESALYGLRNAVVELVAAHAADERAAGLRELVEARGEGLYAMALETGDAAEASRALRTRGVRATPPEQGEATDRDGATRTFVTVELSPRQTRGVPVLLVQRTDAARLRAPADVEPGVASALDHVVIRSADLDAAKRLYGEQLSLRLALDTEVGGRRMLFFRVGGVTVEIVHDETADAADSLWGAAYRVADLDAAHGRLRGAGVEVSDVRDGRKPGTRVFSVRDHDCGMPTLFIADPSRMA